MKALHFLGLLCLIILLLRCEGNNKYCPAYSPDKTEFLPVDFIGKTMRYLIDGDTIAMTVCPPFFSEKGLRNSEAGCHPYASMSLTPDSDSLRLQYSKSYDSEKKSKYFQVWVYMHAPVKISWSAGIRPDSKTSIIPQWTSPNGVDYTDVWQGLYDRGRNGIDTSYFSPRYGLLFYHSAEHRAMLLP
ncbi:MAG: hypothetical protein K2O01_01915 [Bacteroidales bacterium]|nr:hypothetical protein [Bacteroidales bacterium]